jgi:hypothetical protein
MKEQLESVAKILSSLEQIENLVSSSASPLPPSSSSSPEALTTSGDEVQAAM